MDYRQIKNERNKPRNDYLIRYTIFTPSNNIFDDLMQVSKIINIKLIRKKKNGIDNILYSDQFRERGYHGLSHLTHSTYLMKTIYNKVVRVLRFAEKCMEHYERLIDIEKILIQKTKKKIRESDVLPARAL